MPEYENPTRRYRGFRPRQAAYGFADTGLPNNYGTISLFNDSNGAELIVLRDFSTTPGDSAQINVFLGGAPLGTILANATTPMVRPGRQLPGALYTSDETSLLSANPIYYTGGGAHFPNAGIPFGVLQPGQSFYFQGVSGGQQVQIALLWEAIFPDELDFMW